MKVSILKIGPLKIKINIRNKKNFCSKLYKKQQKKFYSNIKLNQTTDNERLWKTIKPILSNKCIQFCTITLINKENVISGDFKLSQTFNNYLKMR